MVTRITGTNAGLDIDALVKSLMTAEKMPEDKLMQKKQTLSWKMDAYRELNTKLSSFRDLLSGMRFSSNWGQSKVASSDPTKVSVTVDSTASNITHSISWTSLAAGASKSSSPGGVSNESLTGSADLSGGTTIVSGSNDSFNVTLNGVTKNIVLTASPSAYSLASLQTEVQAKLDQSFGANQISVSTSGNSLQFTPNGTFGNLPQIELGAVTGNNGLSNLGFGDKQSYKINVGDQLSNVVNQFITPLTYGDFTVNGQDITYSATDTISSIMNKVNSSAAGVNMSYDSITDKFSFTSKGTGATAQVALGNGSAGNFITAINMDTNSVIGTDANVTIDGVPSFRSSNNFTVSGVTYNLIATASTPITATVTQDTDAMVSKIKDFVSQYNDMIGLVNKKLNEPKLNGFPPLTTDQKSSMKDADITSWETKAKSGLLKSDDILASTSSTLRSYFSSKVQSISTSFNTLGSVGITTTPQSAATYTAESAGKIILDENKLRTEIAQDSIGVISLFTNKDTSYVDNKGVPQPTYPTDKQGIAQAMYNRVNITLGRLLHKAGGVDAVVDDASTDLGLQLRNIDRSITDFDAKLSKKETYYYARFSAMDIAIGKSNAQLSALS
ncbi:MAG: hypothetical protein JWM44_2489, partial [Bacilli bacterium]|nr:hypothetical protein [Bacilli bacterium]